MRVAVIGAGWAGLAAAVDLVAGGAAVTLFEAGRVPGGRARTIDLDGRRLDNGQHILLGAYRETLDLMRRVDADPDTLLERLPLQVVADDGFRLALPRLPAPFNVALGLLTARGVDRREKVDTALWMNAVQRRGFRLARDLSVAAWLDAAGQTGVLRHRLWEPLCLAALNTPASRASAQLFANVLRDSLGSPRRADTDLLLPRVPLGDVLPEPAARWLAAHGATLRFGERVRKLSPGPDGVAVDGEAFDAAVLAVAPQHLSALLPDAPRLDYEPIATVYLQYPDAVRLPYPLRQLTGKSGQWVVDRGDGLLACVQSGHGEWEKLSDHGLAAALQNELGLGGPVRWQRVVREKRATFSCRPGLSRADCVAGQPRLLLAGDHSWADYPATLEGAVRSGRRAAQRALAAG
ncbi:MAG: hydroxysqualene dehydroxylase HpnE [Dechloromonas sp.]|uniref:hydroxysqualene dehydroxylase HpnE n=1 Tax=Azonexus sp. TaxID=1872668 RepID=UPI0035AFB2EB|nr:hydroxysqualene dehydroxylase HpnE [Dechloromonas sp.]